MYRGILFAAFIFVNCADEVLGISIQNNSVDAELDSLKHTVLDLSAKLKALNQSLERDRRDPVMFYAVMSGKSITYNVDTILVFETAIVNEGSHYNTYDGVFVAPEKGMYLFSWTVSGTSTSYIVTELVMEERIISSAGEYQASGGQPSGSMTAVSKMDKGDHAWIRTTGITSSQQVYSKSRYPQTAFLGLLLYRE